jgi:hypothetical protein
VVGLFFVITASEAFPCVRRVHGLVPRAIVFIFMNQVVKWCMPATSPPQQFCALPPGQLQGNRGRSVGANHEDISCAITHFGASVQSNYPEHPI